MNNIIILFALVYCDSQNTEVEDNAENLNTNEVPYQNKRPNQTVTLSGNNPAWTIP